MSKFILVSCNKREIEYECVTFFDSWLNEICWEIWEILWK